jgi:hypothetical protein
VFALALLLSSRLPKARLGEAGPVGEPDPWKVRT